MPKGAHLHIHFNAASIPSAWGKFNARTQMMKGLFNYETAYKEYTRQCLDEFVNNNTQYAEIRPNFMLSNQVWKDDESGRADNIRITELIFSEDEAFQKDHQRLMGRIPLPCRRRYRNHLTESSEWDEEQWGDERKNKLARLSER